MPADLIELVHRLGAPHVLVVGDLMLDRYVWGDAARVSQEAPVILLHADRREERLGGASSVAMMLRALGSRVAIAGVLGADADGDRVRRALADLGVEQDAVITDAGRPTTVKERYIGRAQQKHPQQILRVDYERRDELNRYLEEDLRQRIATEIRRSDIVLVSDYDKGVCTPSLLAAVIASARDNGRRVLADPARGSDYGKYRGCSSVTPNRLEASLATGTEIVTGEHALRAAAQLRDTFDLEAGIVTLDREGIALADRVQPSKVFPTRPRQVYDITGAGDMVLSMLGLTLASGAGYDAAVRLANVAGGLEVEKIGCATVSRDEILRDLAKAGGPAAKLFALSDLLRELDQQRRAGRRIAFTNGCFDVLHAGHVRYLQEARDQADVLIVGLNSDSGVRALKGPDRPVNPEPARAAVLAALQAVDFVTVFTDPTPIELIKAIRPDVLVKGADYRKDEVVGAEFVESYGGLVHLAALHEGLSTSGLLQRMKAA
jgi:D-beta-D-heptose 7-phosphate kinase/D-beta-D-heptose 1-phosphate adenosyltransferase